MKVMTDSAKYFVCSLFLLCLFDALTVYSSQLVASVPNFLEKSSQTNKSQTEMKELFFHKSVQFQVCIC